MSMHVVRVNVSAWDDKHHQRRLNRDYPEFAALLRHRRVLNISRR